MELTLEDLSQAEDLDLGCSAWFAIDQARIDTFADATEDHQWIHTDPERAAATPFGGTVAHGFLLLSLVPHLFGEIFAVPEAEMLVNYGIDKVRFIHPVPAGSTIRLEARITKVTPKNGNLLLRVRGNLVLKEKNNRRAVMLETLFLIVTPPTD